MTLSDKEEKERAVDTAFRAMKLCLEKGDKRSAVRFGMAAADLIGKVEDLPHEFSEVIDEDYWNLVDKDN